MNIGADKDESKANTATTGNAAGARGIPLCNNRLDSRDLFAATREITIVHGDEVYRLRLTAQNKLLLTK